MDLTKELETTSIKIDFLGEILTDLSKLSYIELTPEQILAILEGKAQGLQWHLDALKKGYEEEEWL